MHQSSRTEEKTLLHVGAGFSPKSNLPSVFDGWREVRVDIDPITRPDVIASMTQMPTVDADSVDAIWSSHSLEHITASDAKIALSEWLRVLQPDGFAYVTLPDLTQAARLVANGKATETLYVSPLGPVTAIDMIYGHGGAIEKGQTYMGHRTGFTADTLGEVLIGAGFNRADVWVEGLSIWALAYRSEASWERYGWQTNK
jgi:SAM-dependent methyltransferase